MIQEKLVASQGRNLATITAKNKWMVGDELICRETRHLAFHVQPEGRFIDYEVEIQATEMDVVFGDTKEGTMAIRLTPTLRLRGDVAQGHILTSAGRKDKEAWGKRAKWVDYFGPVQGETVGVAIFDHPSNHGHGESCWARMAMQANKSPSKQI